MLGIRIAGIAFALFATTAFAHDLRRHRHHHHRFVAQAQPYEAQGAPYQQAWSDSPPQRYHESGNSCAPDRAEAVWGPGNALMGYSCVPESANGS